MKLSIEETLVDWLGKNSLEVRTIEVETTVLVSEDGCEETKVLYKATGKFNAVCFDKECDGADLKLRYHQFTLTDERFSGTKMEFISETKFKIV